MTILNIRSKEIVGKGNGVFKSYPITLNDNLTNNFSYKLYSSIKDLKEKLEKILGCNVREIKEKDKQDILLCIYGQEEFIERVSFILNNVFRGIDRYSETITEKEINKFLCKCEIFP